MTRHQTKLKGRNDAAASYPEKIRMQGGGDQAILPASQNELSIEWKSDNQLTFSDKSM